MKKRYVSWNEYNKLCDQLIDKIKGSNYKFTHVVAVMRGGYYVANRISEALNIPLIFVVAKSYEGTKKTGNVLVSDLILPPDINKRGQANLLIVDDLVDSGETLNEIKLILFNSYIDLDSWRIATLWQKENSKCSPDFVVERNVPFDQWIVQPFESEYAERPETIETIEDQISELIKRREELESELLKEVPLGTRVIIKDDDGIENEHILAQVLPKICCLISLSTGNRYDDPILVQGFHPTMADVKKMSRGRDVIIKGIE
jgi:hypoxanthine phosphoribosyltransferase